METTTKDRAYRDKLLVGSLAKQIAANLVRGESEREARRRLGNPPDELWTKALRRAKQDLQSDV